MFINIVTHKLFSYIFLVMVSSCSSDDEILKIEAISDNNVHIDPYKDYIFNVA